LRTHRAFTGANHSTPGHCSKMPGILRDDLQALDPPFCLAVSAKRYVLFNWQNRSGEASAHGLGHLMAPYDEPVATRRERIGAPLRQEDLWKELIRAADSDKPDETRFMEMQGFHLPPRANMRRGRRSFSDSSTDTTNTSRAGAGSSPLGSFCRCEPSRGSKWPMISLTLSRMNFCGGESRDQPHHITSSPARPRIMRPIVRKAGTFAVLAKTHARSPVRYHFHLETKFQGREFQRGPLKASACLRARAAIHRQGSRQHRGKRVHQRRCRSAPLGVELTDRASISAAVSDVQRRYGISDWRLIEEAKVSHHMLAGLKEGKQMSAQPG
jgi:hypothetical protein